METLVVDQAHLEITILILKCNKKNLCEMHGLVWINYWLYNNKAAPEANKLQNKSYITCTLKVLNFKTYLLTKIIIWNGI